MPRCIRCKSTRRIKSRGLCKRCWRNAAIRESCGLPDQRIGPRSDRVKKRTTAWRKRGETLIDDGTKQAVMPLWSTSSLPGTEAKIRVMEWRVKRGQMPHHPGDAKRR